jgi:hypothetical protein
MITQGSSYNLFFVAVDANAPTTRLASVPWASGDVMITKPGGVPTASTNLPVDRGGGRYQIALTASETGIGLTDGQVGEILVDIAHLGGGFSIVPVLGLTLEIAFNGPGTLTSSAQATLVAAVAAAVAAPSASAIASAVDAAVADNFAAVTSAIAAIPAAPTTSAVASAVLSSAVDGARTLSQAAAIAASSVGSGATLPMTATGGSFSIRNAAGTGNLITGSIDAAGVRTIATAPGSP